MSLAVHRISVDGDHDARSVIRATCLQALVNTTNSLDAELAQLYFLDQIAQSDGLEGDMLNEIV